MNQRGKQAIRRSWHWIVLFLCTDIIFIFVTWIVRREAVPSISLFLVLFTVLMLIAGWWAEWRRQKKDEDVLLRFLEAPDEKTRADVLARFGASRPAKELCARLLSLLCQINEQTVDLSGYREYIETWVHEVKTPLSLSALVLGNHQGEMSPYVYDRFQYIWHRLNEDVERILYYARLQTGNTDIKYTAFRLDDCVRDVLEEYRPFMEEKKISLNAGLEQAQVVSDRKIVSFILSQFMSNAVKYADSREGSISVSIARSGEKIKICIYNNGDGIQPEDAPFVFDKGFTGNYQGQSNATGMGLYLAKKYAQKLCADVGLDEGIPYDKGFGVSLVFLL